MRFLTYEPTRNYSLVTLVNYDIYQTHTNYLTHKPTQDQHSPNTTLTLNNNDNNDKKEKNEYTAEFEQFWKGYPRKEDKQSAFKVWNTRLKDKHTPEQMTKAAQNYAAQCRKEGRQTKYIKLAATFIGPSKPFLEWLTSEKPEEDDTGFDYMRENEERMKRLLEGG